MVNQSMFNVCGMRILVGCDGTLEDIAAVRKLQAHRCFVLTDACVDIPFVTCCSTIPKLKFDVAIQLNGRSLDVDCKCVVIERSPLRIFVREHGTQTVLKHDFTQQLLKHQPLDTSTRTHMEQHLFDTLVTRSPVDIDTQMDGLAPFVNTTHVYKHRFTRPQTVVVPSYISDLAATIAYVADGEYNAKNNTFTGSLSHWRQRLASYHLPCLSLVAIAVALTPTCELPAHTLQTII